MEEFIGEMLKSATLPGLDLVRGFSAVAG